MQYIEKSKKLEGVCYDIRGPVLEHATRLEEEGHRILKLNIGNPQPFGFDAPAEILQDLDGGRVTAALSPKIHPYDCGDMPKYSMMT